MGGAESIDKVYRTEGSTWWREEIPSYIQFENGLIELEKNKNKVDYILTHTCPQSIIKEMVKYEYITDLKLNDPTAIYLEEIKKKVKFKHWYFGHFHLDINIKKKFNCLYEKLILI